MMMMMMMMLSYYIRNFSIASLFIYGCGTHQNRIGVYIENGANGQK
jgi:hypothetical protein